MTTANELIRRSLRHINVPGRGAALSSAAVSEAFEALQELLDSNAVTKQFVPGIRRHFFTLSASQSIYKYGPSAQADFRSDDFDDDPAPIRVEDAFIRSGTSISDNEEVDEYRFENAGNWVLTGAAQIANNELAIEGIGTATQSLGLADGTTYTVRVDATVNAGEVLVDVQANAVSVYSFSIDATGSYEFDVPFAGTVPTVVISTDEASDDVALTVCSIIERGKDRQALPDGQGSDYILRRWDQKGYNRDFSKGNSGRPYRYLYERNYPLPTIRLDQSGSAGDILVLDVLVNRVQVNSLNSTIRLHPDGLMWLGYALADHVSGDYGKALKPRQVMIMNDAWDNLSAGNRRTNKLRVDAGLMGRSTFDINRGDP